MIMNPFSFGMPHFRIPYPPPQHAPYPPPQKPSELSQHSNHFGHSEYFEHQAHELNLENSLESNNNFSQDSEEYFEILGLKLHFDDLLIIAILFFLYQEEVKDTYLYIALILLLLS